MVQEEPERPEDEESERGAEGYEPQNLREWTNFNKLWDRKLRTILKLRGAEDFTMADEMALWSEILDSKQGIPRSKEHVVAVADVPHFRYLVTETGRQTDPRVVGFLQGEYREAIGDILYCTIREMRIDPTVQPATVREFLLEKLMARVRRKKTKWNALRVIVPPEEVDLTALYLRHGFREGLDGDDENAFIWKPR